MAPVTRAVLLAGVLALAATQAAPAGAQGMKGMSGGLTINVPMGQFDSLASMGWGIAFRLPLGDPETRWSGRGSLGFDYFKGKGQYSNIQFVGAGADLVHRSAPTFYQFVGFTQSQSTFTGVATGSGFSAVQQRSNFGFTGGVGVNFEVKQTKLFVEFAATTVFTGSKNSNWFPVRGGVRF